MHVTFLPPLRIETSPDITSPAHRRCHRWLTMLLAVALAGCAGGIAEYNGPDAPRLPPPPRPRHRGWTSRLAAPRAGRAGGTAEYTAPAAPPFVPGRGEYHPRVPGVRGPARGISPGPGPEARPTRAVVFGDAAGAAGQ